MTEEEKQTPTQTVTIGDREFEIRLDRRAMYLLEREFGPERNSFWYYEQLLTGAVSPVVELIWAGIRHDNRAKLLTPEIIAGEFGHDDMEAFREAQQAVSAAFDPHMRKVIESVKGAAAANREETQEEREKRERDVQAAMDREQEEIASGN